MFRQMLHNIGMSNALREGYEDLPSCPSDNSSIKTKMSMGHRWKDTDKVKPKYSNKILSQRHFVHHKTHAH